MTGCNIKRQQMWVNKKFKNNNINNNKNNRGQV